MISPFGFQEGFQEEHKVLVIATSVLTIYLPGFVLGVAACWQENMLETIIAHPSLVLMPTFTHFTFRSNTRWCRGQMEEEEEEGGKPSGDSTESFITFSPKFTIVNIILSIIGSVIYCNSMRYIAGWDRIEAGIPVYLQDYFYNPIFNTPFILIPILGFLLTLSSLLFISKSSHIHSVVKYTLANLIFNIAAYLNFSFMLTSINAPDADQFSWGQQIYFLPIPVLGLLVTCLKIILAHYCNINLPACISLPRVECGAVVCSNLRAHYVLDANGKPEHIPEYDEEEEVNNCNDVLEMSADTKEAETVVGQQKEEMLEVVHDQPEEEHQEAETVTSQEEEMVEKAIHQPEEEHEEA